MIFKSVVFVLLVAASSAYTGPLMCLRYCGNVEFDPVCGTNGMETKLFNNLCELKNAECGDRVNWIVKPMAECLALSGPSAIQPLSVPKPSDFEKIVSRPVHAKKKHGKPASRTNPCDMVCPEYYLPMCGYDGEKFKAFANLCFMQLANCNTNKKFVQATVDKCDFNVAVLV